MQRVLVFTSENSMSSFQTEAAEAQSPPMGVPAVPGALLSGFFGGRKGLKFLKPSKVCLWVFGTRCSCFPSDSQLPQALAAWLAWPVLACQRPCLMRPQWPGSKTLTGESGVRKMGCWRETSGLKGSHRWKEPTMLDRPLRLPGSLLCPPQWLGFFWVEELLAIGSVFGGH